MYISQQLTNGSSLPSAGNSEGSGKEGGRLEGISPIITWLGLVSQARPTSEKKKREGSGELRIQAMSCHIIHFSPIMLQYFCHMMHFITV